MNYSESQMSRPLNGHQKIQKQLKIQAEHHMCKCVYIIYMYIYIYTHNFNF